MALAPVDHRPQPRLSAGQIADYLAATSMLSQMGILRGAKYPTEARPLVIQYQHARKAIAGCLAAPGNANRIAAHAIVSLEQKQDDPASRTTSPR